MTSKYANIWINFSTAFFPPLFGSNWICLVANFFLAEFIVRIIMHWHGERFSLETLTAALQHHQSSYWIDDATLAWSQLDPSLANTGSIAIKLNIWKMESGQGHLLENRWYNTMRDRCELESQGFNYKILHILKSQWSW